LHLNKDFQLTYCTNIHPGFDWTTTFDSLRKHVPKIKKEVAPNIPFGLGLRLSNKASEELDKDGNMARFKTWLSDNDVYVFTMNGFPYGNFHDERVKENVHTPDWTTEERVVYTKRMFDQLASLLVKEVSGGISTSPISYKYWHKSPEATHRAFTTGAQNLAEIALHLHRLEKKTGKYLHLDIEPEPDGMLENSDEVLGFFSDYLLPIAKPILKKSLEKNEAEITEIIHRYITVCYDICHFSLAYEEPKDSFRKFEKAGIKIGKIQVSAALKICANPSGNEDIWKSLALFDEPTYLHQVTEKLDGKVKTYNDLPIVLRNKPTFKELRAHFHVPIFLEKFEMLFSTQDHILKVIDYLSEHPISEHLEIETYTWDVLPVDLKKELSASIIREIDWFINVFKA